MGFFLLQGGPQGMGKWCITTKVVFEIQSEIICVGFSHGFKLFRFTLGQVNHAFVIAKVHGDQLWQAIHSKPFNDQSLEMTYEEIGQVKTAGFGLSDGIETLAAGKEFVTMGTGYSFDSIFVQHLGKRADRCQVSWAVRFQWRCQIPWL